MILADRLFDRLPNLSNRHLLLLFLILLSIRVGHRLINPRFYFDSEYHIGLAHNILEGRGLTTYYAAPADLSSVEARTPGLFPPGYTYLLAALMGAFGWSGITALMVLDALSIASIMLLLAAMLLLLAPDRYRRPVVLLWLFLGLSPLPWAYGSQTDLLALCLGMLSLFALLLSTRGAFAWRPFALAVVAAILAAWIRYQYLPLMFLPPFLILILGNGRLRMFPLSALRWRPFLPGILPVLGSAILLIWWIGTTYRDDGISSFAEQIHFENWLAADAFPIKAFFYLGPKQEVWLRDLFPIGYRLLRGLMLLLSLGLLILLTKSWLRDAQAEIASRRTFGLAALGITALTVLLVFGLSLFTPPECCWHPLGYMTYVRETRYFYPILPLLILTVILLADASQGRAMRSVYRLLLLLAIFIGLLTTSAMVMDWTQSETFPGRKNLSPYLAEKQALDDYDAVDGDERVIYASWRNPLAAIGHGYIMTDYEELLDGAYPEIPDHAALLLFLRPANMQTDQEATLLSSGRLKILSKTQFGLLCEWQR